MYGVRIEYYIPIETKYDIQGVYRFGTFVGEIISLPHSHQWENERMILSLITMCYQEQQ
jgi:hypothetical protein